MPYIAERYSDFSIELDCAPGAPRPGDLLPFVLEGTGLEESDFDNTSRFLGNWIWILKTSACKDETFVGAKPMLKERIQDLYNAGAIRYGSW